MIPVTRIFSVLLAIILTRFGVLGWAEKTDNYPWVVRIYRFDPKFIQ